MRVTHAINNIYKLICFWVNRYIVNIIVLFDVFKLIFICSVLHTRTHTHTHTHIWMNEVYLPIAPNTQTVQIVIVIDSSDF